MRPSRLTEPALLFKRRVEARWPERRVIAPRILGQRIEPVHSPLRDALATERLRLLAGAPVSRILLSEAGDRAVGVELIDARTRERSTVTADLVFLCASAIESVRILLNSRCARHPEGVGNDNRLLGRYLIDHNLVVGTGSPDREYQALASSWTPRPVSPLDLSRELDFYIPSFCDELEDRTFTCAVRP